MDRPNILFIMTDQHRFDYVGCAGADFLRTPNLDRLAAGGIHFSNCFSNSPLCAPARISLATGLDPLRTGALDNNAFLQPEWKTYYMRLRDHGYRVGCVGKLDLAKPDRYNGRYGDRPCVFRWGFTHPEEVEGKEHSLMSPEPLGPYGFYLQEQGLYQAYYDERRGRSSLERMYKPSELPAESFLDAYQGRRAVEWLERVPKDFPWHFFVSFSGPHSPHDPPREYMERYAETATPPPVPRPAYGLPFPSGSKAGGLVEDPALMTQARRAYCAYIELIDEWIGQMLDVLERRGLLEDTYIFFSSDHGEMLGDLGLFGKSVPYEPSLHVPLVASGPGIPAGRVSGALLELSDVNPTICHLAGLRPQERIDARSFHPCFDDPGAGHREEAVASHRNWYCIRTQRHKFVQHWGGELELYDLANDPHEERNCYGRTAEKDPGLIRDLRGQLRARQCSNPHGGPASPRG